MVTPSRESSDSHLPLARVSYLIGLPISRILSIILSFVMAVLLLSLHGPRLFAISLTSYSLLMVPWALLMRDTHRNYV